MNGRRVVDYAIRLADSAGRPVSDADVRLRGRSSDGTVLEAALEPSTMRGSYEAAVLLPSELSDLALRIRRADRVLELPLGMTAAGATPR